MNDIKIFTKYVLSPSGFLKDLFIGIKDLFVPKRLSIIFIVAAIVSSILLPYNRKIVAGMFLFLSLFIQFRMIYKTGDHNRWRKEQIKKLSQKVKKDVSLLSDEHLEQRNKSREDITGENAVDVDTHLSDTK